jgi:hypothetical protein
MHCFWPSYRNGPVFFFANLTVPPSEFYSLNPAMECFGCVDGHVAAWFVVDLCLN